MMKDQFEEGSGRNATDSFLKIESETLIKWPIIPSLPGIFQISVLTVKYIDAEALLNYMSKCSFFVYFIVDRL